MKNITKSKTKMIAYMIVVGIMLGWFSVISDNIPYDTSRYRAIELVPYILGGTINNSAILFLFSTILGYKFCSSLKQAMLAGAAFTIYSFSLYFLIDALVPAFQEASTPTDHQDGSVNLINYLQWYLASMLGGITGSATGYLAQTRPIAWIVPVAFIVFQLARAGQWTWHEPIGLSQNILLILIALGIGVYAVYKVNKKSETSQGVYS
jgi:hypothetical protein